MGALIRSGVVDLDAVAARGGFVISERVVGDFGPMVLVKPHGTKWDWEPDELGLRSLLCWPGGRIASRGFPKFFNYGERPDADALLDAEIANGTVHITEKLDGTLVIGSLIDGQPHWRTRGHHDLGDFAADVLPLCSPHLLAGGHSTLLEYTGPANRIVLGYDEPRLTPLAMVRHECGHIGRWRGQGGAKVHHEPGHHRDPRGLLNGVRRWEGREGVVVWAANGDGDVWLTKFKTAEYVRLHSLISGMTERKVWLFCAAEDAASEAEARAALWRVGLDWETIEHLAAPWVASYLERRAGVLAECDRIGSTMAREVEKAAARARRKAIATVAKDACDEGPLFNWALHRALGNEDRADEALRAHLCGHTVNEMRGALGAAKGAA